MSSHGLADPRSMPPGQRLAPELRPVSYGRVPRIDVDTWSLRIGGDTQARAAVTLSWADILSMPQIVVRADHHCVSRHTTLDLEWSGVAARAVIDLVPPADDAPYVLVSAARGYSSSIRLEDLSSPRAVFATHLDGEPLSPEHGWPLRLVLPHLYGWKGPKWVGALDYHRSAERGFWEQRGYHLTGDVWREERYSYQE